MTAIKIESSIKGHFAPLLRTDGFKGSGRTYRRLSNEMIHILHVQGSLYGGQFCIELGIHPFFCPDILVRAALLLARIRSYAGRKDDAILFARYGLQNSSGSTILEQNFKDILSDLESINRME